MVEIGECLSFGIFSKFIVHIKLEISSSVVVIKVIIKEYFNNYFLHRSDVTLIFGIMILRFIEMMQNHGIFLLLILELIR